MVSRGHAPKSNRQEPSTESLEPHEILGNLRARLLAPGTLDAPADPAVSGTLDAPADPAAFDYGRDVAGLHLVTALDTGAGTMCLRDQDMERLGHDTAWSAAINNLFSLGVAAPEQWESEDGAFFCLDSKAVDHATWLAFPDELFSRLGFTVGVQGAFMTAPSSGILNLHVIGEGTTYGDVHLLTDVTARQYVTAQQYVTTQQYAEHPSGFSPHLYWWDGFAIHQMGRIDDEDFGLALRAGLEEVLVR